MPSFRSERVRMLRDFASGGSLRSCESSPRCGNACEHILRALEQSSWNLSGAARALGMERTNLHKRIRALGLSRGK
jgi:two-component system nitrogen regulation response regulator NtrX